MKVVHLVNMDIGGAAKAAFRLNDALRQKGIDSKVLVLEKKLKNSECCEYFNCRIMLLVWKVFRKMHKMYWYRTTNEKTYLFAYNQIGVNINKNLLIKEADIIHIHWISNGFIKMNNLLKMAKNEKKIVWTLHDMFAFTGGCHYNGKCKKYVDKCLDCKYSKNNQALIQQNIMKEILGMPNVKLVACSQWMEEEAKKASITNSKNIFCIPNCLDNTIFNKLPLFKKQKLYKKYNFCKNKKIILLGAMNVNDQRKGSEYIEDILNKLSDNIYEIVVFGALKEKIITQKKVTYFGKVNDDKILNFLYNCADVFITLSKEENLANTVLESLATETPVVAFRIGGMDDMIQHMKNGYLVKPFDTEDFVRGINYCCNKDFNKEKCFWQDKFDKENVASKYCEVYENM